MRIPTPSFAVLRTCVAVLAFGLGLATASAQQAPLFTDQQKSAIGDLVRDYLLKNPEVLQDAMAELEKRQKDADRVSQKKAIDELQETLRGSSKNVVLGNPNGDITLVEFFDYNCGYCKRALSDIRELLKTDPKLRYIIKDFPVLGPDSIEAAVVAIAAKNQLKPEKYWEFHQKLLETKGRVGKERAMQVAKEVGIDQARLAKDMESPDIKASIEEAMKVGDALKVQGTPAFVVGDEVVFGAVGYEPLKSAIASIRQCGKSSCG
jgi:protein-disulfide isomerase